MNAMKYHLTPEQKKIVQDKVAQEIDVQMRSYLTKYDALWLWAVAETFGFRKERLEKLYRAFYEIRKKDKAFYDVEGFEGLLENETVKALAGIGVDIEKLAAECGEPVVKTVVHKGKEKGENK